MYFKKLEIFGFKSFADKTVLNFEPGITAIVGPNGCGKSNIFDSIRWVLGEQSVKELRGGSMEDVIFNGTEKKPSLGFAEVSVTFSNETKAFPLESDDVTITRRLFRSGESEYLINKQTSRLKDIQELLMGTGIGAEAYSLVQQGKVDLVVSSKPEDRRMILDEASGITKYKTKKREALNKLKDTENNLLRINDIIVEVKRQIGSIERQANKARKYKDEFEKLKGLEVKYARYQIDSFANEKSKMQSQVEEIREKTARFSQEIEELNNLLTQESELLTDLEHKINEIHSDEIKLDGQIDLNNRQIGFNQERIDNLHQNDQRLVDQKNQLIERCRQQQSKIEEIKESLASFETLIREGVEELQGKKDQLSLLNLFIKEAKEKIKNNEEKILGLTTQQVSIRNELTEIMKEIQGCLARKRRLDIESEKVSGEKLEVEEKFQSIGFQINHVESSRAELMSDRAQKASSLADLNNNLSDIEKHINDLERKKLFLNSQKEFIEKLNTQYQDIPDPVVEGRFITSVPPLEHHTGIIGKVKEVKNSSSELYEIVCETKFIELDPQQISAKIEEISMEIVTLISQKEELLVKISGLTDAVRTLDTALQEKEKSLSILESQKNDISEETKKLLGELELVDMELHEVKESMGSLKAKEDELNYKLDTINQDLGWSQNDVKEKQAFIASKSQEREEITVAIAQRETEIEADKDRIQNQQDNLKLFTETLDNWLEEIKKIDDEVVAQKNKKQQYEDEIQQLQVKIEELKQNKESLTSVLMEYRVQKEDKSQRINSIQAQSSGLQEEMEKNNNELHTFELSQQQISFSEQGIKDRLAQSYKIQFDEIPPAAPEEAQEALNVEELLKEVEVLRKRCDAFGSVNLVAIEEYEELKTRFEFLTKQQADLIEAKSQLMNTISKINRTTRQMFMDTFTKVSEEFRIYFRMLFGGGEANLVLLDPENVLESGIEIVARPPGKKLQTISLLSGGEKSLTAIALVFGVFKVNPSPFCVLDEIDAALDESNVGRFSYLLKDFSKIAQFIVVTHNKKTISSADVMYGITMQETGVSRIVSVKFSDEKKKEEPQLAVAA